MREQLKVGYVMDSSFALRRTYLNAELVLILKTYKTMFKQFHLTQNVNIEVVEMKQNKIKECKLFRLCSICGERMIKKYWKCKSSFFSHRPWYWWCPNCGYIEEGWIDEAE